MSCCLSIRVKSTWDIVTMKLKAIMKIREIYNSTFDVFLVYMYVSCLTTKL